MNDEQQPQPLEQEETKPTPEGLNAAARALEEIRRRSFSGRHPELGKMIKCQVCGLRHREIIKCEPRYKELYIEEDLETGELTQVFAKLPIPGTKQTLKQFIGARQFKGKRRHQRPTHSQQQIVELTRKVFPSFDGVFDDPHAQMRAARKVAIFVIKFNREQTAKRIRRQQDTSRRINHGLLKAGSRPRKFGRLDKGPRLPK